MVGGRLGGGEIDFDVVSSKWVVGGRSGGGEIDFDVVLSKM